MQDPAHEDPVRLADPASGDVLEFHASTFRELLVGILVEYAHRSEPDARALVEQHPLVARPVRTYDAAVVLSHESEYHWAMLIAHGEGYWRAGVAPEPPPGYDDWESTYLRARGLPDAAFRWLPDA